MYIWKWAHVTGFEGNIPLPIRAESVVFYQANVIPASAQMPNTSQVSHLEPPKAKYLVTESYPPPIDNMAKYGLSQTP